MNVRYSAKALEDFDNALEYYTTASGQARGNFVAQFDLTISLIAERPLLAPQVHGEIRRYILGQFPVGIYYTTDQVSDLLIVAILHLKRSPTTLTERINSERT